jgi:hypothetical protein
MEVVLHCAEDSDVHDDGSCQVPPRYGRPALGWQLQGHQITITATS